MKDDQREVHHYHHTVPASCNGHHCYHSIPGSYGGSRSDTYDASQCCRCGASEPNPYDNERR